MNSQPSTRSHSSTAASGRPGSRGLFILACLIAMLVVSRCGLFPDGELARLQGQLADVQQQHTQARAAAATTAGQMQALQEQYRTIGQRRDAYIREHVWAVVSLKAGDSALATYLNENVSDDTRQAMVVVGAAAVVYCLVNGSECGDVGAELSRIQRAQTVLEQEYLTLERQLKQQQATVTKIASNLATLQQAIAARQGSR